MKIIQQEDIEKLEAFLDKKEVKYFDLRVELIDHICTAIEEVWMETPELSFDETLEKVYQSFGIFGFATIIENREESLRQHYWKSIGRHMLQWLKLPQIFLTILLGYILFYAFKSEYNIIVRNTIVIGTGLLLMSRSIQLVLRNWKKGKQNKPVVLIDHIMASSCSASNIIIVLAMGLDTTLKTSSSQWIWTLISLMLCFLTYHLIYDFPKNKRKYFRNSFILV